MVRGLELVGTDPVCDAENLRRIGDVFERYGSFGEEDALVGVGGWSSSGNLIV